MFLAVYNHNTKSHPALEKLQFNESGQCSMHLETLPGTASGLHLEVYNPDRDNIIARKEIPAEGKERVLIEFENKDGLVDLRSPERDIISLPLDNRYRPVPAIRPCSPDAPVDIAIIIDGSALTYSGKEPTSLLLDDTDEWHEVMGKINDMVRLVAEETQENRVALLAFGDMQPSEVAAKDLIPGYHLYPNHQDVGQISFGALQYARFEDSLASIPKTSGGDFVDALADALHVCNELHWRPEARKIIFIFGDSPGHSIIYPPPGFADINIRKNDVDSEALRLHRTGVEIVTLYNNPPEEFENEALTGEEMKQFLPFARNQYKRLASLPEYSFSLSNFDPEKATRVIGEKNGPIARGACYGHLFEVEP